MQSINYSLIISRLKDRYFCPTGTSLQGPEKPTCGPAFQRSCPYLHCAASLGVFFFFILVVCLDPSQCFISLVSSGCLGQFGGASSACWWVLPCWRLLRWRAKPASGCQSPLLTSVRCPKGKSGTLWYVYSVLRCCLASVSTVLWQDAAWKGFFLLRSDVTVPLFPGPLR